MIISVPALKALQKITAQQNDVIKRAKLKTGGIYVWSMYYYMYYLEEDYSSLHTDAMISCEPFVVSSVEQKLQLTSKSHVLCKVYQCLFAESLVHLEQRCTVFCRQFSQTLIKPQIVRH